MKLMVKRAVKVSSHPILFFLLVLLFYTENFTDNIANTILRGFTTYKCFTLLFKSCRNDIFHGH